MPKYNFPSGEMTHIPLESFIPKRRSFAPVLWAVGIVLAIVAVVGFNLWLDSGCGVTGVITEHGKACID